MKFATSLIASTVLATFANAAIDDSASTYGAPAIDYSVVEGANLGTLE